MSDFKTARDAIARAREARAARAAQETAEQERRAAEYRAQREAMDAALGIVRFAGRAARKGAA